MRLARTISAALAIGGLAVIAGCSGGDSDEGSTSSPTASDTGEEIVRGEALRLGMGDDLQSWDTTAVNQGIALTAYQAPYDTLIRKTPEGDLVPMLATEWTYDEAQTALTLELESGITFSDGTAFDGEAVKANLEHYAAGAGPLVSQLSALDSVEVVDADTVVLNLATADPAFLTYLASGAGYMASPTAIEAGTLEQEPVGTGPYVMDTVSSVAGSQYVFTMREDYWAPELQLWNSVEFRYLEDGTANVNALISGQVDASELEPTDYDTVTGAGLEVLLFANDWEGLIIFDRDGELVPALADARVRQAINYSIDRDVLNESQQNGIAEVTSQIFGADTGAYVEEFDSAYTYDPEMARTLLAEAGYADGFEMHVPVPGPLGGTWTLIGQMLADVGITVVQDSVAFPDYRGVIAEGQYPAALFRFTTGDPWGTTIRNYILPSAGVWNPFGTQNADLDALIEDVHSGGDQYQENAQGVNQYVVEEAWFVPFFRTFSNYAYNADVVSTTAPTGNTVPALYSFVPVVG